ncbi:Small GTPase superfamily ARF/SAR type [Penicillium bovifimosum]|uniref:Small GTPase superfamily ARF/SAR type n=1 Tax=Penicillium bovifimosum TaxID=126998 RepID=A0A9W9GXS6_9EURO|nr:Small GTPase superfamily ARF/SAR type [Penicillium bovifimosum]KAJ5131306.1 Small GTPase superfamily ARF/SAR type [Penicillium bovifimosum]
MTVPNESSEDVNDFLQRIRELGERRDKEDDERTKKLEEEILQGRKERQARRAERARSLALTDDSSTLNMARLSVSSISPGSIDPPEQLEPTPHTPGPETLTSAEPRQDMEADMEKRRGSVPDLGMDSPSRVRPPMSRSRAGTLSWQQRPSSRDIGNMSPGSTSPTRSPTRASHLRTLSTASDDTKFSQLQFGFPRPSNDATVLPPSPDREARSIPYKVKKEETDKQTDLGPDQQEAGVGQESHAELDTLEAVEERSSSPPRTGSRDSNMSHRFSVSSVSATGLGSPVHLSEAPKLEPRQNESSFEEPVLPSPTQRRLSPERSRSTSPTKGLGGFVQSAMMRRSDSVSKRWSAQLPQGLGRSNSIVSNRSSVAGPLSEVTPTLSKYGREPSTLQRPGSSHSEAPTGFTERPTTPSAPALTDRDNARLEGSPGRPPRPLHSRSASAVTADGTDGQTSPFVSKTMDPRRWSPTKASWLESALNRPESPRQSSRPPSQPNWARDRQSRGSIDMGRVSPFKEVTPLGLMRTPPPGTQFKTSGVSGPSLPASPTKGAVPDSPAEFPFKKSSISGHSVPPSPTKDVIPESPSEFPLKRPSISGPSMPSSPLKETLPESPSAVSPKKSTFSGTSATGSPGGRTKEAAPESPLGVAFKKPSISGSSIHRNSATSADFPLKKSSISGSSVSGGITNDTAPESSSTSPFKRPSISGPSIPSTPERKAKETVPESPLMLGLESPEKVLPEPSSHVEQASESLEGGAPTEEPKSASPNAVVAESQDTLKSTEPETTPEPQSTPTRREPPDSLSPKPNFSLSTSSRGRISPQVKPAQPPLVDFRANLRKREVVKDTANNEEPEFKNVFGRLKKTETRHYVAPDELKGNILRGKAALNTTGGPKKTERVDEFRNSLVSRKEEMKASGGSIRRNTAGEKDRPKPAEAVPEAIAIRQNMTRANSIQQNPLVEPISPTKSFGSRASQDRPLSSAGSPFKDLGSSRTSRDLQPSSPFRASDEPGWPLTDIGASRASREIQPLSPLPADDSADKEPEKAPQATSNIQEFRKVDSPVSQEETHEVVEPTKPSAAKVEESSVTTTRPVRAWPPAPVEEAATTPSVAKGKLASRINPALASLLTRGPPAPEGPKQLPTAVTAQNDSTSPSAPLTHVTKGRARGPKRRLPQTIGASNPSPRDDTKEVGAIPYSEATPSQTPPIPIESSDSNPNRLLQPDENSVPDTEDIRSDSLVTEQLPEVNDPPQNILERDTPESRFPLTLPTRSLTTDFNIFPSPNLEASPRDPESPGEVSPGSGPPVPPKSNSTTSSSPVASKPTWVQQDQFVSSSPSPLRTSQLENQMRQQKPIPGVVIESARSSLARPLSHPSPPVPPKDSDVRLNKPTDPRRLSRKMSAPSLVAQASEAREVIGGFFKSFPDPRDRMDIDPGLMLMRQPDDVKIRTVRRQMWELTGDGRRQELPSHQEYILYQGSMYLCVHTYETERNSATEVYLWRGDDVPDSSVDDEQPFARKVARENSCKLQIIRQGKEPTRFIQALGGILITRRGSNSRHNSSALYMLCGRKHLGEMAFDEVNYSLRNLCSGFPYVVSAPFGKLYLWKGKGSGPEETGAARLIGMDLGLTGEFEEVSEGEEPEDFFDVFAGPKESAPHMSQDYWKLKPKYNHYRTRLLRVDHELNQPTRFWNLRRPGSGSPVVKPNDCVQEIEPFCYRDITDKDVYVLDTFFEIYVIIGDQATQKSADFASAVVFAHEYGILATSLQDRPFIPKSFVALGGIPDRCQSAFRKWNPRAQNAPFVYPLDVVIEALRSPEEDE